MFNLFAHAGHAHTMDMESMEGMNDLDHCMPIIVGASIVVAILVAIIIYFLVAWQPKTPAPEPKTNKPATKKKN